MAEEIKITKDHDPGLYDSDTGKSLKALKVVDITEDCAPTGERVVLLFTKAQRGRIVQVTRPYKDRAYIGEHIHFFVDEKVGGCDAGFGDTFTMTAARCGFSAKAFSELIRKQAPPA